MEPLEFLRNSRDDHAALKGKRCVTAFLRGAIWGLMFEKVERIAAVGDLHGNASAASRAIRYAAENDAQLVIQVGDFGWWPTTGRTRRKPYGEGFTIWVDQVCRRYDIPLLWIRGNHEHHPLLFEERRRHGVDDEPWWLHDHVGHWPDGLVLPIGGRRWLAIGGAHSVDRSLRTSGVDHFDTETLDESEIDVIARAGHMDVDVVVAHEAPIGVPFLRHRLRQSLPAHRRQQLDATSHTKGSLGAGSWPVGDLTAADDYQRLLRRVFDGQVRHGMYDPGLGRLRAGGVWLHGHHHVAYTDTLIGRTIRGLGSDTGPVEELVVVLDPTGQALPRRA